MFLTINYCLVYRCVWFTECQRIVQKKFPSQVLWDKVNIQTVLSNQKKKKNTHKKPTLSHSLILNVSSVQIAPYLTLHFGRPSATKLWSVKLIGWTVLEICESQTDKQLEISCFIAHFGAVYEKIHLVACLCDFWREKLIEDVLLGLFALNII